MWKDQRGGLREGFANLGVSVSLLEARWVWGLNFGVSVGGVWWLRCRGWREWTAEAVRWSGIVC